MALPTSFLYIHALVLFSLVTITFSSSLSSHYYYAKVCPKALPTIKRVVEAAVHQEPRMGGSLLRLHFHDCFVNGCDASILLDPTPEIDSEKNARPNVNSTRGFEVIDRIKAEVDRACGCSVVSCADILAVAARDSVVALGGPSWKVRLGRRDARTASRSKADADIPGPLMDLPALTTSFRNQGLNLKDLVALSGGHTLGFSQCFLFRDRIHSSTNIDPAFARQRRATCPQSGFNSTLAPLDQTPAVFDAKYYDALVRRRGLLPSDQALFSGGGRSAEIVKSYSKNPYLFSRDFAKSMVKMGNIKPLTGKKGEIRLNCRRVNY